MLKRVRNQKGFTLIELIAVIAILGILALLIVPRVGNYSNDARLSRARADFTMVKNAVERYDLEHTVACSDLDELTAAANNTNTIDGQNKGPYISAIPAFLNTATPAQIRDSVPEDVTNPGGVLTFTP